MNLGSETYSAAEHSARSARKKDKVVELIEIDGKRVSKTSTGKRKFHKKSKTGCDNCKRRRIKCDEGKPICKKCTNMKLDCSYSVRDKLENTTTANSPTLPSETAPSHSSANAIDTSTESSRHGSNSFPHQALPSMYQKTTMNSHMDALVSGLGAPSQLSSTLIERLPSIDMPNSPMNFQGAFSPNRTFSMSGSQPHGGGTSATLAAAAAAAAAGGGAMHSSNSAGIQASAPSHLPFTSLMSNPLFSNADTLSQLTKMNLSISMNLNGNLPSAGFPTAGIGGINYDFQELFGFKLNSKALKVSSAEEALANMQQQREQEQAATNSKQQELQKEYVNRQNESLKVEPDDATAVKEEGKERKFSLDNVNNYKQSKMNESTQPNVHESGTVLSGLSGISRQTSSVPVNSPVTPSMTNNPTITPLAAMTPVIKGGSTHASLINHHILQGDREQSMPQANSNTQLNLGTKKGSKISEPSLDAELSNGSGHSSESSTFSHTNGVNHPLPLGSVPNLIDVSSRTNLNLVDLKLFHHYCTEVWPTIIEAGISGPEVWSSYLPALAFEYPFLMHSLLAFSATHLSRTERGLDQYVASHRLDALRLLREAVLEISDENTDALVASSLILIMDSLANACTSSPTAWIFHVKGAVTILTAVWPLPEKSKFFNLISVDLSDLGDVVNQESGTISELMCFDDSIANLYPVELDSPYLITLAYLDKLYREKNQLDFILRVFAFPALLDKTFLALLMTGDLGAMRIMRSYYKLLRGYTTEIKDKVWFLEGVSLVLPQDVDEYSGGGGMNMMLDFLGGGLPSMTTTNLSELM